MDEVWNRKYERGPIRRSIRPYRSMRAWRPRSARDAWDGSRSWRPTSNSSAREQRYILDEWAIWLSEGAPAKTLCSLAWKAQSAPNSRMNSPYDPAHGAPELSILPCMGFRSLPLDANLHLHLQPSTSSGGNELKASSSNQQVA